MASTTLVELFIWRCSWLSCWGRCRDFGLVHSSPQKVENGPFTLKMLLMFSVHTVPEEFESANADDFGFVFEEDSGSEITWLLWPQFSKSFVFEMFSVHTTENAKPTFSNPSVLKSVFEKAPFSWRISVDGRSNRKNKAAFSWRISVDGKSNRKNKAAFSWRISVDGRSNRKNKAAFSWRISVDGRSNRKNKAAFSNLSGVVWTQPLLTVF